MLPQELSICGKRGENSRAVLHVNVARFWIDGRTRVRIAQIDHVAKEVIEEMLPNELARFRIETSTTFLERRAFPFETHDVELAVGDYRRRLARKIHRPQCRFRVNFLGQSG